MTARNLGLSLCCALAVMFLGIVSDLTFRQWFEFAPMNPVDSLFNAFMGAYAALLWVRP